MRERHYQKPRSETLQGFLPMTNDGGGKDGVFGPRFPIATRSRRLLTLKSLTIQSRGVIGPWLRSHHEPLAGTTARNGIGRGMGCLPVRIPVAGRKGRAATGKSVSPADSPTMVWVSECRIESVIRCDLGRLSEGVSCSSLGGGHNFLRGIDLRPQRGTASAGG